MPAGVAATADVVIAYNNLTSAAGSGNGEINRVDDGAGFETYSYDSLSRTMSKTRTIDVVNSYQTQYQYNAINQSSLLIYPSGKRVRENYDSRGRPIGEDKVDSSGSVLASYVSNMTYNVAGQVTAMTSGSGVTESDTDIYDFCVDCYPPDYGGIGITELRPTGNLMMRDGTLYRIVQGEVTYIRDRNGNLITFAFGAYGVTKITDSLNREVNINYVKDGQGNPLRDEITYRGFGGNARMVTVNYGSLSTALRSGFVIKKLGGANGLFPELNGSSSTDFNPLVVTSVTLPNNKSYQFYYDSYGELARVILPTGGAYEYDYECGLLGGVTSGVVTTCSTKEIYRRVVQKLTYVDGQGLTGGGILEGKMNFGRPEDSSGGNAGHVDIDSLDANDAVMAHGTITTMGAQ